LINVVVFADLPMFLVIILIDNVMQCPPRVAMYRVRQKNG